MGDQMTEDTGQTKDDTERRAQDIGAFSLLRPEVWHLFSVVRSLSSASAKLIDRQPSPSRAPDADLRRAFSVLCHLLRLPAWPSARSTVLRHGRRPCGRSPARPPITAQ